MPSYLRNFIIVILLCTCSIQSQNYHIIDTGQEATYDAVKVIPFPLPGDSFYGQDAQFEGTQFSFTDNGNGTITDENTGLMWQKYLFEDKFNYNEALTIADNFSLNGYSD